MKSRVFRGNLFTMILVMLNFICSMAISPLSKVFKLNNYSAMFIVNLLFLAVPLTVYFIITRESPKQVLKLNPLEIKDILLIVLIAIFIQPLMNFLSGIMALIFPNNVADLLSKSNNVSIFVKIFVMAVMPAVLEELCMRGIVLSNYKQVGIKKSAILTGFLFAILHMNIQMFLYTFIMGIVFAYLVYITNSIYSSILTHFIINGTQIIIASNATQKASEAVQDIFISTSNLVKFIIGGAIIAILSILIVRYLMKKLAQNHQIDLKNMEETIYDKEKIYNLQEKEVYENSYISAENISSNEEISSSIEVKEKIVDIPFMIIIAVYIIINTIIIYNLFK